MGTIELRKKVIESIATVDERFLRMVEALYKSYTQEPKEADFFEKLPNDIQNLLTESLKQIEEGEVASNKEVIERFQNKYNIVG